MHTYKILFVRSGPEAEKSKNVQAHTVGTSDDFVDFRDGQGGLIYRVRASSVASVERVTVT